MPFLKGQPDLRGAKQGVTRNLPCEILLRIASGISQGKLWAAGPGSFIAIALRSDYAAYQ